MSNYLIDTSVWHRADLVPHHLTAIAAAGALSTCGIVELEIGYSARNQADHAAVFSRRTSLQRARIDDAVLSRALEVQWLLAARGWHRLRPADVIIAAAAEQAGMTVLHYDSDFERIAEVTGQPHRWVAPRGSL